MCVGPFAPRMPQMPAITRQQPAPTMKAAAPPTEMVDPERIKEEGTGEDKLATKKKKALEIQKVKEVKEVPIKDVSGAGDTFLAGLVVEYLKTKDIKKSIKFAQECTTKVVQKHGVATV